MAFLGGLQGLGALAGGVQQGIGSGLDLNTYMQNQQAQSLAGNILKQAYQANPNLFAGGQAGGTQQPLGGLGAVGGAGAQPVSSETPGLPAGPGTANVPNLFSPWATQANQTPQPQAQAQSQPSPQGPPPQPQPQGQGPAPASGRMGGGQQQTMTLPQAFQLARRVAPNADGGQLYRGVMALAQGGLVGYGAMTPYQAANLARENMLTGAQLENIQSEMRKRSSDTANQQQTQERERAKEADTQADKGVTESLSALNEAKSALAENRRAQDDQRRNLTFLVGQPTGSKETAEWKATYKDANDTLSDLKGQEKNLKDNMDNVEKAHTKAVIERQQSAAKAAKSYGGGGDSGGEPDYVTTPDGKLMHYKGTGPRSDTSSYEEVQ